ncbi:hypothetical protein DAPPUDRAFT_311368 [Daphnia pulex]|uniref:Uncharacterized protein n=1 Tax=Daphnia pulex TaxID=6669 RepID=E9FWP6_DAPPU|nr:hypothetical protein DAPPUDRAFT_311368 [Daphnia pulex]|eukprot:EFX88396.1 hypothetical protein DAPPUDRAFT_311368 [Daphnia pulex]
MGSKKKAEEDITPGCEEHGNPPKKRKTMSLLPEVESTEKTDAVVSKEEEVQMSANFLLSEHKRFFEDLFEAPFSDLVGIMKTLTRKCSNMPFVKKNDQKQPGYSILPTEKRTLEKLFDDEGVQRTSTLLQNTVTDEISLHAPARLPIPNHIVQIFNTSKFTLFNQKNVFKIRMEDNCLLQAVNPGKTHVVHSTLAEFFSTLKRKCWDDTLNANPHSLDIFNVFKRTLLSFQNLMTALIFSFSFQVKLHDIPSPNEQNTSIKSEKVEEVSSLILRILELLMSVPKSENESTLLRNHLATYIHFYERKRKNQKQNLLLKLCLSLKGQTNEFKLIKLMLDCGADTNIVNQHRDSPLHLLAKKEVDSTSFWHSESYSTRAEYFTSVVRVILDGRFHEDQVNLRGQSALECLKPFLSRYPNAQLCMLVGNFLQQLQGVRPLSCIAAKVVRKHQLPCECLPVTLQSMVLQH